MGWRWIRRRGEKCDIPADLKTGVNINARRTIKQRAAKGSSYQGTCCRKGALLNTRRTGNAKGLGAAPDLQLPSPFGRGPTHVLMRGVRGIRRSNKIPALPLTPRASTLIPPLPVGEGE